MHCAPDTLDEVLDKHTSNMNKGGVLHLESLLLEISTYKYSTASQIIGAINTRIDILKDKESTSEPKMTSEQYHNEANLDALTDGKL